MRILIVEDDFNLYDAISFHLKNEGYIIDHCYDGKDALYFIKQQAYDLILLDRMLPSLNGITVLTQVRNLGINTPIILVTALDSISNRVEGLDAGADDYLVKPFAMEELLARIRALNRRPVPWESIKYISYSDITLDLMKSTLTGPSNVCSLSKREHQLAEFFLKNPHHVLHRNVILLRVWGSDAPVEDGNLDNYIYYLRRRFHAVGSKLKIKTVRSIGYYLENPSSHH